MSQPPLESTRLGTSMTNGTTSHIESIHVGTKTTKPTPQTQPTEFPEQNGKLHVPGELDPDPSSSDSSSNKSKFSKDRNYSKLERESDKKKEHRKHNK